MDQDFKCRKIEKGRNCMKRQLTKFGLLIAVALFAAVASAQGQSLAIKFKANIPFDFTVADKELPAGQYWIGRAQPNAGDLVLAISNSDDRANAMTMPVQTLELQNATKLIFHRYGDQYFLSEVWVAGSNTGREIPKSHEERQLERKAQGLARASTATAVETVCIVAGLQ
jgi:hypothetical protein